MPSIDAITVQQLSRLIGLPGGPRLIDVRADPSDCASANLLPTARHLSASTIESWGPGFRGTHVVVYCHDGGNLSQGTTAWLRNEGVKAEILQGGLEAWRAAFQPAAVATFLMCLPAFASAGVSTVETVRLFVLGLPCLLLGSLAGWSLYGRLDETAFRKVMLWLLLGSGIALIPTGR